MTRFLFVVPPLNGHINPLIGVAAELTARGHQVAWAGPDPWVADYLGDHRVFPAGDAQRFASEDRPVNLRGFSALKYLWEQFLIPLADEMVDGVAAAVEEFAPDVIVADQQAFGGALVAIRAGIPWITSATTSGELTDPLAALPKVAGWVDELQRDLLARHGFVGPQQETDLRFSGAGIIAFTTGELAGPVQHPNVHFVGPSTGERADEPEFPWESIRQDRPLIVVTMGTANARSSERFLGEAAMALAASSATVQGLIVDPAGTLPVLPGTSTTAEGVLVQRYIPQPQVLAAASAVVCHGGHNTVCEALQHGVPLVIAPIRDDQPVLAQQVVDAGAGIRLRFDRVCWPEIVDAIDDVLGEHSYRINAKRVGHSFAAAGGATAAADALESARALEAPRTGRHHG